MDVENLKIETQPSHQDVDFLEGQLNAYNIAKTGIPFGGYLSCFIRNDQGKIVAGLYGYTWGACCQIEVLWVHEHLRGKGYGTSLLKAAEAEAMRRGCSLVVLDTHSFQAEGFYLKHGYEIAGAIAGYPLPEYRVIYLYKRLSQEKK